MTAPETDRHQAPSRRDVLRYAGAAGTAAVVVAGLQATGWPAGHTERAVAAVDGVLDLYVNEGNVPMVDGSLVYLRGFGDRATTIDDPFPSLTIGPQIFFADGRLVADRLFPPDAVPPPLGRPEPTPRCQGTRWSTASSGAIGAASSRGGPSWPRAAARSGCGCTTG